MDIEIDSSSIVDGVLKGLDDRVPGIETSIVTKVLKGFEERDVSLQKAKEDYGVLQTHMNELSMQVEQLKMENTQLKLANAEYERKSINQLGKEFESASTDYISNILAAHLPGIKVEKKHANAADVIVIISLPTESRDGAELGYRHEMKVLVECKNESNRAKETRYMQTLAANAAAQDADAGILLYANIDPVLHDYASDKNVTHEKVGLKRELMFLCTPQYLVAAMVRLLVRLQPLALSEVRAEFEAMFRVEMQHEYDRVTRYLKAQMKFVQGCPLPTHYAANVKEAKDACVEMKTCINNNELFAAEKQEARQALLTLGTSYVGGGGTTIGAKRAKE